MNLRVGSREYKLLLDHREFQARRAGITTYGKELVRIAQPLSLDGTFGSARKRRLVFLDTPDLSLRRLGLLLRYRLSEDQGELTLKCRSEDRYVVAGTPVETSERFEGRLKLEEDIAIPFVSRYSLSNTTVAPRPSTWEQAADIFPILKELTLDGRPISTRVELRPVNGFEAFERVYDGPTIRFDDAHESLAGTKAATVLILWSDGEDGRTLVAEFSFRLKDKKEAYSRVLAREARSMFERLQRHDWAAPRGVTKTQFAYGDLVLD